MLCVNEGIVSLSLSLSLCRSFVMSDGLSSTMRHLSSLEKWWACCQHITSRQCIHILTHTKQQHCDLLLQYLMSLFTFLSEITNCLSWKSNLLLARTIIYHLCIFPLCPRTFCWCYYFTVTLTVMKDVNLTRSCVEIDSYDLMNPPVTILLFIFHRFCCISFQYSATMALFPHRDH